MAITKSLAQLEAELAAMTAKAAELEAANLALQNQKRNVTVDMAEFGAGTISIRGINRFPISVYPPQIALLRSALDDADKFAASHINELRSAAYAAEFVRKSGIKWDENAKGETANLQFKALYKQKYLEAMKDTSLVSTKQAKSNMPVTAK